MQEWLDRTLEPKTPICGMGPYERDAAWFLDTAEKAYRADDNESGDRLTRMAQVLATLNVSDELTRFFGTRDGW